MSNGDDDKPTSPHDALFRAVFATPAHMAEELRVVLPEEICSALDLSSLTPVPGKFTDANLLGAETDSLFSANTAAGPALIYVLVQHQSAPDRYMPLRLLRYIGRILDAYRRREPESATLPPVLPVVLYHAERPWPYPRELASLYALKPIPDAWAPHVIDFQFVLDDLARTPSLALAARPVSPLVAVALFLFKRARYAVNLLEELEQISDVLGQLDASPTPDEQRSALFRYTWAVGGVEVSEMSDFVRKHTWPNLEGAVMTTAEKLRAEGLAEGRAKGLAEGQAKGLAEGLAKGLAKGLAEGLAKGQAQVLLSQVRSRFPGAVPPEVERAIAEGTPAQIEKWALRFAVARSAQEVIEE